ncbi:choice-of-anchor D domain-containing protein [Marinilabiliaceae bacterium JC017]|nr:choice-of-anchor D domain-containing protein [Marinilabiliaceae bacterium JC017]
MKTFSTQNLLQRTTQCLLVLVLLLQGSLCFADTETYDISGKNDGDVLATGTNSYSLNGFTYQIIAYSADDNDPSILFWSGYGNGGSAAIGIRQGEDIGGLVGKKVKEFRITKTDGGAIDITSLWIYVNSADVTIKGYNDGGYTDQSVTVSGIFGDEVPLNFTGVDELRFVGTDISIDIDDLTYAILTPTLTTQSVSGITASSATLGGNVTNEGAAEVSERGVVYSTSDDTPTIGEDGVTKESYSTDSGTGAFSESIGSLSPGTTYYYNAYAINSEGTSYGTASSFTTLGPEMVVKGNSMEIADGDDVPSTDDHTDFGSIDINATPFVRTFTIENTGAALLTLGADAVSLSGEHASDYAVSSQPATSVAASGTTTFQISFTPSALGTRTAEISIANDDSDENPYNFSIEGTRVNAAPTATAPTAPTVEEDAVDVALADDIQVADADADDTQTVTFAITGGTFTIGETNITFSNGANGSSLFTASGTLAAINTALDAATYTPTPNLNGVNAGVISFISNDGTTDSNEASVSFDITPVNDAPTASDFTAPSIIKGIPFVFSPTNFGYSDVDGDDMVKISVNQVPSEGILYVDADNGDDYDSGEELSNGANINKADLDNGNLQYYNNTGTSSFFEFAVYDGTAYSTSTYTATLNIIAFPTVTTQAVSSITATTATGNGNITDLGVPNPTTHGVCWNTSENPTTANSKDDKGAASATGAFTCDITGLSAGTTYYARAFARNDIGTVYGSQVSFTTNNPPTVKNRTFTDIHKGNIYPNIGNIALDFEDEDVAENTDAFQFIRILTLPGNGTLFLDVNQNSNFDAGETIVVNQVIGRNEVFWGYLQYLNTDGVSSSFTYEASDGNNYSNTATVTLTVRATPTVTFTNISQTISEATETITITAQLSEAIDYTNVTVPFSVNGSSSATGGGVDYSISGSPITIIAGETSKEINITLNNDVLDEPAETVVVNMGEPTNAAQGPTTTFTANIIDDDLAPTVAFNTTSSEGLESVSSANLRVDLSTASSLPISVNYTVSGSATRTGADCTIADGTLNFAASETSKNISIASIVDDLLDEYDETLIVTLSSPSNATLGDNKVHTYTIKDDDPTPTVAFTSTSSNGLESVSSAKLQVDLSATSGREIRVNYAVTGSATGSGTDYTFADGILIIGDGNPNSYLTIASIVNDLLAEGNETVVVTLSNPSNAKLGTNTVHTYTITDDDDPGFTIAETDGSTTVAEPNTTDTYTVVLDAQPLSDVVLKVESSDTGEVTVDKASLTFTSGNWSTPQTVTVTAADEDLIDGNQTTNITLSVVDDSSDDAFDVLADKTVIVTTNDNDVAGFSLSKTTATITESGTDDSFTVVLNAEPTTPVVLNISDGGTDEATLDKTTLTFTGGNWDNQQTVTITPVDDYLDDGDQPITLTISVDADGSDNDFDTVANKTVTVTSTDDDTSDFVLSKLSASVQENGTLDSFTARLTSKPASDVVLNVVSSDEGEVTVDKAKLTFTAEKWSTAQTVTLTGMDDSFADGDQTVNITLSVDDASSDNAFDGASDQMVACITTDDENLGFTLSERDEFWEAYTAVWESGTTDEFKVVLDGPPATDVVLSLSSGDTGEVTVSPSSLTFTNANWNSEQTVTVTGVDDVAADGSQITAITISVNDGSSNDAFDALADQTLEVTTVDDDSPGITVIETNGNTIGWEAGKIDTLWVVLNAPPVEDVVLSFARALPAEMDVEYDEYEFKPDDWNTPKDFRIAGRNDGVLDGDVVVPLTIGVVNSESDAAYHDLPNIVINAINIDNEVASFSVENPTSSVDESVTTAYFSVVLDVQPVSDVVFSVTSGDTEEVTVNKSTLTFTNANWDTKQIVTLTGVNDDLADGSQSTDITISVDAANSQDEFDDLEDKTVRITTTDDDANFTLSKNIASVAESGTTDAFTAVLNAQPLSNVVLSVVSEDENEATVNQAFLTFTPTNWNNPQTITVTGVDENVDDGNQTISITISIDAAHSDNAFDLAQNQMVSVTNTDDDSSPVITSLQSFTIDENFTGLVGTVEATDDDAGTILQDWTITSCTLNNTFIINPATGEITVNNPASLDWEVVKSCELSITVSDGTNTSAEETVTININDVIEVGFNDLSHSEFRVYPNPTKDILNVDLGELNTSDLVLEVLDNSGMALHHQEINTEVKTITLDLINYPRGVYLIRISNSDFVKTQKVIVN